MGEDTLEHTLDKIGLLFVQTVSMASASFGWNGSTNLPSGCRRAQLVVRVHMQSLFHRLRSGCGTKLAKDVFRTEYISARKAAGLKSYVTSDEFRKEFDEAWKKEEANPVSLERLEGEAGQSISAKVAKAKAKTAAKAKAKAALTCPSVASSSTAIVVREKPNLTDLTGMHSSETMERVSTATYTHASRWKLSFRSQWFGTQRHRGWAISEHG